MRLVGYGALSLVHFDPYYYSENCMEVVPLVGSLCYRLSCFLIVRHPHVRNFNSVISIDVIRIKSNVVGFFNPSCVTRRVMVNIPP